MQNKSLRMLEIRFLVLNKRVIQTLLRALTKNETLQKLSLTHNALVNAQKEEFIIFGEALKANATLLILDLSYNDNLEDDIELHEYVTDSIIASNESVLQKFHLTS